MGLTPTLTGDDERARATLSPGPLLLLVVFAAFGGPLALAALYAPGDVEDVTRSGGLIAIVAAVAFLGPLAVWLRFSRDISSSGGLTAFVEASVGRRIALVQAALWVASYTLYLLYTSAYVVYDVLPAAWPGVHDWRPLLAGVLPAVAALAVVSGRRVALAVIGLLALGQLVLLVLLDVVAVQHAPGAAAFHGSTSADAGRALGGIATLFVCGSLPLFLGGEVRGGGRALGRLLVPAFVVTAIGVVLAVYPIAQDPAFAHAHVPGLSLVRVDLNHAAGTAVGIGVAGSIMAVLLLEYIALTRLLHYVSGAPVRTWVWRLGIALAVAGPVSVLLDPDEFYDSLIRPSLILLWLSQLIVVAAFPVYLWRRDRLRPWHVVATILAVAVMAFGFGNTVVGSSES
jgi:hypothetical protein